MTHEDIVDDLNDIVAAQSACKRIIVWNMRLLRTLKHREQVLRDRQKELTTVVPRGQEPLSISSLVVDDKTL